MDYRGRMRQTEQERKQQRHEHYMRNRDALIKKQLLYQQENKEQYRAYQKGYHSTYEDVNQAARMRKWRQKNPKKHCIRSTINYYRQQRLITQEPCAICGNIKTECHHFDYSLPLCVVHLCKECHRKIHSGEVNERQIQEVFVYERIRR